MEVVGATKNPPNSSMRGAAARRLVALLGVALLTGALLLVQLTFPVPDERAGEPEVELAQLGVGGSSIAAKREVAAARDNLVEVHVEAALAEGLRQDVAAASEQVRPAAEYTTAARVNRTRSGCGDGSSRNGSSSGNPSSSSSSSTSDPGLAGGAPAAPASAAPAPAPAPAPPCWNASALGPLEKFVASSRSKWNESKYGALDSSMVSMDLCHRAITNLGDHSLLRSFASKLVSGRCTQVVVLAGSVACGGDDGMRWPYPFKKVLDATWPCSEAEGHVIHNLCRSGTGSTQAFQVLQRAANQAIFQQSDLIVVDKSVK